ncbi:MAG: two-component system response regulator [Dehalococcoidia bacterium]|nr:two-component system response regulator [Dehalococcoidia bacterium]|tara:strand:- start:1528 stop:1902 length:375 start_codon:yes stop_codon:yes gene_type:complete
MIRLLLVEDNEMNRDMLTQRLQRKGYVINIAVDGMEGVQMAKTKKPDLILMDMSLPIIDGREATRLIKGSDETKHIPVIALTSHAMAGDRERFLEVGCNEYDTKPIDFYRLLTKIENLLSKTAA